MATIRVGLEHRGDGVYLILRPAGELRERGWRPLERGPYKDEEAARADEARVLGAMESDYTMTRRRAF